MLQLVLVRLALGYMYQNLNTFPLFFQRIANDRHFYSFKDVEIFLGLGLELYAGHFGTQVAY